jgi:hypothetical protein
VNEALAIVKDEILEAVALAVASLRKDHTAEVAALKDTIEGLKNDLSATNRALWTIENKTDEAFEKRPTVDAVRQCIIEESRSVGNTFESLVVDSRKEVDVRLAAIEEAVKARALDEDLKVIWDTIVEYPRKEEVDNVLDRYVTKEQSETSFVTKRDLDRTCTELEAAIHVKADLQLVSERSYEANKKVDALSGELDDFIEIAMTKGDLLDISKKHATVEWVENWAQEFNKRIESVDKAVADILVERVSTEAKRLETLIHTVEEAWDVLRLHEESFVYKTDFDKALEPLATQAGVNEYRDFAKELVNRVSISLASAIEQRAMIDEQLRDQITKRVTYDDFGLSTSSFVLTEQLLEAFDAVKGVERKLDAAVSSLGEKDVELLEEMDKFATADVVTSAMDKLESILRDSVSVLVKQDQLSDYVQHKDYLVGYEALETLLNAKADTTYLESSVAGLATNRGLDLVVGKMASQLRLKADIDFVKSELDTNHVNAVVRTEDLETLLSAKADTSYVEDRVSGLAASERVSSLAAYLDVELSKKADTELVSSLAAYLDVELSKKADTEFVKSSVENLATLDILAQSVQGVATISDYIAVLDPQVARIASIESQVGELRGELDGKATPTDFDTVLKTVRSELIERYQGAETWLRGGAGYQAYALCYHKGALWQSLRATKQEPGEGDYWMMLTDGVESVDIVDGDPGYKDFVVRMASGTVSKSSFKVPVPCFKGVFNPELSYEAWDSVAKDGHVFLCLKNNPNGAPGEVQGEWQVFSGPRGKTGKSVPVIDEREVVNSVLREVVPQIQEFLDKR